MLSYKEYEIAVFNWLLEKHNKDSNFNFSLRQKGSKGAELDYFIGKESSRYFGTTFWNIPVAYPGSAMDLIDVFFKQSNEGKFTYFFEFRQRKSPHDKQNKLALDLIKSIKNEIKREIGLLSESDESLSVEDYKTKSRNADYDDLNVMLADIENDLNILIPIIENGINEIKRNNKNFKANRITNDEFNSMLTRLNQRFIKYGVKDDLTLKVNNIIVMNKKYPLNQILFGPPGTGKTFRSIKLALEIINDEEEKKLDWNNWYACKVLYDKRVKEGRIGFITFHQSMSYEDFIEGIKPLEPTRDNENLSYAIQDGIFKNISLAASNRNNLNFELAYSKLLEDFKINENGITIKEPNFKIKINLSENGIDLDVESDTYIKKIYKSGLKYVSESQRFVGTWGKIYKPIFKLLTEKYGYRNEIENIKKNYVLIIDEINRGNVAQIFGELITLIEDTKRTGMPEALKVMLPYSKKYFEVPENLFLIGTMNTADRSVEALDAALRRRFSFTEMPPEAHLLNPYNRLGKAWGDFWIELDTDEYWGQWNKIESEILDLAGLVKDEQAYAQLSKSWKDRQLTDWRQIADYESIFADAVNDSNNGIRLERLLNTINMRIEKLLDKDYQIGHSYFLSVNSIDDLKAAFQNKIIPLLQEYFFGDYAKIGLVLGKGFVEKNPNKTIFAEFDAELASELSERPSYTIKNVLQMTDIDFRAAIDLLIGAK
jgi:5-methylcytosine-specific restriction protein B